jgi:hypothetical protein
MFYNFQYLQDMANIHNGVCVMSDKQKYKLKDGSEKKVDKEGAAEQPVFKTEEMLKQEARLRLAEQDKLIIEKSPKTERGKKIDNYFYHYKWQTILGGIGLILLIFFIRDTLFRPKPDITAVVATSRYIAQYETDALQAAMEKYGGDLNGDGKVLVNLDMINLPIAAVIEDIAGEERDVGEDGSLGMASGIDPEMVQASMMKLMAIIAAWNDPLFLMDDDLYTYINEMSGPSDPDNGEQASTASGEADTGENLPDYAIFEPLGDIPGASGPFKDRLAIKDTILASEEGFEYLGDLSFSVRPPPNSNQKNIDYQANCVQLLRNIAIY